MILNSTASLLNRRIFLLSTFITASTSVCKLYADTSVRPWSRTFSLNVPATGFIQHCLSRPDGFFTLTFDPPAGKFQFCSSALDGTQQTQLDLSPGIKYSGLGIRTNGNVLLPCSNPDVGMEIREIDRTGKSRRVSRMANGIGILGYCVVGEELVMLRKDGSLEAVNLDSLKSRFFSIVLEQPAGVVMYPVSGSSLLLVNGGLAKFCWLDLQSDQRTLVNVDAPEIESSKVYFAAQASATAATAPEVVTIPTILKTSAPDPEGNLFGLIYPLKRDDGALMVKVSHRGAILQRFRVRVPTRSEQPHLPRFIAVSSREVTLIFPNGKATVYAV